jgi:peptide chain release factor 1
MDPLAQRIEEIKSRQAELEVSLADPALARDRRGFEAASRTHRELSDVLAAWGRRELLRGQLEEARAMTSDSDPEMAEMARAEAEEVAAGLEEAEHQLKLLLLPRDLNDARNTIVEIRAGTGGNEASLFAGDLLRMYSRYAEERGWRVEMLSANESNLGGFKEVIVSVIGEGVYSRLKFEGGTHRVQRVPATETQGRIHTSAVTVAVMPEAEEVDVTIKAEEIKVDVFRSSGPGGQSVNTTDSAVRITHLPTGLLVSCQDEKSQLKNKNKALKVLRSRLLDLAQSEQNAEATAQRRAQVGTGDRSGRIRTYNFPQNRMTDHRINLALYSLDQILDGQLARVIDPLIENHQAEMLKGSYTPAR